MRIALLIMLSVFSFQAHARSNELRKVVDGTSYFCKVAADASPAKLISMIMKNAQITVSVVKCTADDKGQGHYVLDSSATTRSYVAPDGEVVDESYTHYELVMVNADSQVIGLLPLTELEQTSQQTLNLQGKVTTGTDFFVRAVKSFKSESGISDKNLVTWGSYRL